MPENSPQVDRLALTAALRDIFAACALAAGDAAQVAEDLVAADTEGLASHGAMLVPMYVRRLRAGSVTTAGGGEIVSDRQAAVVVDAGCAMGQLVARQAVALAVERARAHGAGIVAVRNAFHFGTAGRYARLMADQGCVGIVAANTRPLMPAPGGAEALTGNNPLAIAVPGTDGFAPNVDMALSASAMGRIRLAEAAGEPIPEGWAVDAEGRPTTDPAAAIAGMLLPAGGPKGFGLAFLLDLICGGLAGGAIGPEVAPLYGDPAVPYRSAQLFIALDTGHFGPPETFAARVQAASDRVAASRPAPGVDRVHPPGERTHLRARAAGQRVPLAPATVTALREIAAELALDISL